MRVVETLRDTTVRVAADSSMIRALLECDSLGKVQIKRLLDYQAGSRLRPPVLTLKENVLTATATADSMAIYLRLKDRLESRTNATKEQETVVVEVNRLTWWQALWCSLGKILAALLLLWSAAKLYKLLKR